MGTLTITPTHPRDNDEPDALDLKWIQSIENWKPVSFKPVKTQRVRQRDYEPKPDDPGQPISFRLQGVRHNGVIWAKGPAPSSAWVIPDEPIENVVAVLAKRDGYVLKTWTVTAARLLAYRHRTLLTTGAVVQTFKKITSFGDLIRITHLPGCPEIESQNEISGEQPSPWQVLRLSVTISSGIRQIIWCETCLGGPASCRAVTVTPLGPVWLLECGCGLSRQFASLRAANLAGLDHERAVA